jgi:hypothetical protein
MPDWIPTMMPSAAQSKIPHHGKSILNCLGKRGPVHFKPPPLVEVLTCAVLALGAIINARIAIKRGHCLIWR